MDAAVRPCATVHAACSVWASLVLCRVSLFWWHACLGCFKPCAQYTVLIVGEVAACQWCSAGMGQSGYMHHMTWPVYVDMMDEHVYVRPPSSNMFSSALPLTTWQTVFAQGVVCATASAAIASSARLLLLDSCKVVHHAHVMSSSGV
jgi:hypothetical protein